MQSAAQENNRQWKEGQSLLQPHHRSTNHSTHNQGHKHNHHSESGVLILTAEPLLSNTLHHSIVKENKRPF